MNEYTLSQLDPNTFEHLVNSVALRILGAGATGFGPGPDGGRDGYFQGETTYPSVSERWKGQWYIQSKYHAPNLSSDHQKWLLSQIESELKAFTKSDSRRNWPENWIVATNIDPSAAPETGTFDKARALVAAVRPELADRFHIWGGGKVLDFVHQYPDIAAKYGHFLTPGHLISELKQVLTEDRASQTDIAQRLIVSALRDQRYTKLEQAGATSDNRPGVHHLFVDLPYSTQEHEQFEEGLALRALLKTSAENHKDDGRTPSSPEWSSWHRHPERAPVWFVKGGPGQGKSTISQFFCQLQRAALVLTKGSDLVVPSEVRNLAEDIRNSAVSQSIWPQAPRIPVFIELKDYAQWAAFRQGDQPKGVLSYIASRLSRDIEQTVHVGTLKRLLPRYRWAVIFDGLDEVPGDSKDALANEVISFAGENRCISDLLVICTSRPQGYSGQFDAFPVAASVRLTHLSAKRALACAEPLVRLDRPAAEAEESVQTLRGALESQAIRELMISPLQSHIMAVLVRDGRRPPEKKWDLYKQFYDVIRAREANKNFPEQSLAKLLRQDTALLKGVHNRLGFVLHSRAETAEGAQASLDRDSFESLVRDLVAEKKESKDIDSVTQTLVAATEQRLVLISTPDDGARVRFDVRQLQEFFAAEFLYDGASPEQLRTRLQLVVGDSHWQEVVHFLMSALVEQNRRTELHIANGVLQWVDSGGSNPDACELTEFLASGSGVVARLLDDGVLEEDKGLRSIFADRLRLIAQGHSQSLLGPLVKIKGPTTKAWLKEQFVKHISRSSAFGSVGALRWMWRVLKDGDVEINVFRERLKSVPAEAMHLILEPPEAKGLDVRWKAEVLYEFLSSPDSLRADPLFLPGLRVGHVSKEEEKGPDKLLELLGERHGPELATAFVYFRRHRVPVGEQWNLGNVIVQCAEIPSNDSDRQAAEKISPSQFQGILSVAVAAFRVAVGTVGDTVSEFTRLIGDRRDFVRYLGVDMTLGSAADRNSNGALGAQVSKSLDYQLIFHGGSALDFDVVEFSKLAQGIPKAALDAYAIAWDFIREKPDSIPNKIQEILLSASLLDVQSLLRLPHIWGLLFTGCRPQLEAQVRRALCSAGGRMYSFLDYVYYFEMPPVPFLLDLPNEHGLLVPIAASLLTQFETQPHHAEGEAGEVDVAKSLVARYVPSIEDLVSVADSNDLPVNAALAATVVGAMHPSGGVGFLLSRQSRVIELAEASPQLSSMIPLVIDVLREETTAAARVLLAKALAQTYGSYVAWNNWSYAIGKWRERSYAPLSRSGSERSILLGCDI